MSSWCHFSVFLENLCIFDGFHVNILVRVFLVSFWRHFGVISVSFRRLSRNSLRFRWISRPHSNAILYSVILVSFWCHFSVFLENLCIFDGFPVDIVVPVSLASSLCHFGVILTSFWCHFSVSTDDSVAKCPNFNNKKMPK